MRRISLGRELADMQRTPWRKTRFARTLSGRRRTSQLDASHRITIESGPIQDYAVADEIEEMAGYLRRGGLISLAEDQAAAWAGYATSAVGSLVIFGHAPWSNYSAAVPTVGERLALHGTAPALLEERGEVESLITVPGTIYGGAVLTEELRNDWTDADYVLGRQYGFWPILRMPEDAMDRAVLRHRHRRYWTLELTLETDEHALAALAGSPDVQFQGADDLGLPTMTEYLRQIGGV